MSILYQNIKVTRGSAQAVFVATSSGLQKSNFFRVLKVTWSCATTTTLKKPSSLTLLQGKPPISQMMMVTMLGHHETSPSKRKSKIFSRLQNPWRSWKSTNTDRLVQLQMRRNFWYGCPKLLTCMDHDHDWVHIDIMVDWFISSFSF